MKKQKLVFVSGLPRSGSTLLMNLLGQNPEHYVSPTSGLVEIFKLVRDNWKGVIEFQAEGLRKVKPRVLGSMHGIIDGYYRNEFRRGSVVFEKSRGWLQHLEEVEEVFGPVKTIVPVRDVREILASFERLYQERTIAYDYPSVKGNRFQTIEDRCNSLLRSASHVGSAVHRVRDVIRRRVARNLIVVPFHALTVSTQAVMDEIHGFLGLPLFRYELSRLKQITREEDLWYGLDLHRIRKSVTPASDSVWKEILPEKYGMRIHRKYQDIYSLAAVSPNGRLCKRFPFSKDSEHNTKAKADRKKFCL